MISMYRLCWNYSPKPLDFIRQSEIKQGGFPTKWEKANAVPIHKKATSTSQKYDRTLSFLPICEKIFERLIYTSLYEYFMKNGLISSNKSGSKLGDSCINKLLSITHEVYQFFDDEFEVMGIFLGISKAVDKVWHKSFIYKLKKNGVVGNLADTLAKFLNDRKQSIVLNGQNSTWLTIEAGVPLGSVFGSLLFYIYMCVCVCVYMYIYKWIIW